MASRAVLLVAALCIVFLAAGVGAAASGDDQVTLTETDETVIVEVNSCEGYCILSDYITFDVHVNGEKVQTLGYDEQHRVESTYTDDTANVTVTKTRFWDAGWAFEAERSYPAEQSADGRDNAENENASDRRNGTEGMRHRPR